MFLRSEGWSFGGKNTFSGGAPQRGGRRQRALPPALRPDAPGEADDGPAEPSTAEARGIPEFRAVQKLESRVEHPGKNHPEVVQKRVHLVDVENVAERIFTGTRNS